MKDRHILCPECGHVSGAHGASRCFFNEGTNICPCKLRAKDFDNPALLAQLNSPNDPEPTDIQHLATAIEGGLLTLAESIKYAVDIWAERNPLPIPLVSENEPWRPAIHGDKIILTGEGTSNTDYWRGRLVTVTGVKDSALEWREDATGKEDHGCFNAEGRFHHVRT